MEEKEEEEEDSSVLQQRKNSFLVFLHLELPEERGRGGGGEGGNEVEDGLRNQPDGLPSSAICDEFLPGGEGERDCNFGLQVFQLASKKKLLNQSLLSQNFT